MASHLLQTLSPDQLLSTTCAARRRLDLQRPIELCTIRECCDIATQAPSGSNLQNWHFVIITDPQARRCLADLYCQAFQHFMESTANHLHEKIATDGAAAKSLQRVNESASYLADHLHEIPVHVIPCLEEGSNPLSPARLEHTPTIVQASSWGSIFPAVWSFMLAARACGLGTSLTTLHLYSMSGAILSQMRVTQLSVFCTSIPGRYMNAHIEETKKRSVRTVARESSM